MGFATEIDRFFTFLFFFFSFFFFSFFLSFHDLFTHILFLEGRFLKLIFSRQVDKFGQFRSSTENKARKVQHSETGFFHMIFV